MLMISFFKRGIRGIGGHKMMSAASVCIVAASLILFGAFIAAGININAFMSILGDSREINVYIAKDVSGRKIEDIDADLRKIEGVNKVTYRSKEDRLENVAEQIYGQDSEDLTSGENILRDSFVIVVSDAAQVADIAKQAEKVSGVEEIVRNSDIINGIDIVCETVEKTGMLIMLMLFLLSVFIIFNTIKLCVTSHGDEIRLMKTIGATDGFIIAPYMLQGVLLALVGAIISGIIIICVYGVLEKAVSSDIISLVPMSQIALVIIPIYCVLGIVMGIVGAAVSVGKYLGQKRG